MKRIERLRAADRRRGTTLIEVLIAMAILALLMVGVLQLFSLALVTDSGSAARTDMSAKAAQVAENLRYLHFLRSQGGAMPGNNPLAVSPLPAVGVTVSLPWDGTETTWPYWGPAGANVIEQTRPPYRISYTYSASTTPGYMFVTVTVVSATAPTGLNYLGPGAKVKRVDYVCQVRG